MNKTFVGLGMIKGGVYETITVAGIYRAFGKLEVNTMSVSGILEGQAIAKAYDINVSGIIRFHKIEFAEKILVSGVFNATAVTCKTFGCIGKCRIGTLQADEITISKDRKNQRGQLSKIHKINCKKLVAHDLKADMITADEVHLYGNCKIETLNCKHVTQHGNGCTVKYHIA